jgi:hypothetical protein
MASIHAHLYDCARPISVPAGYNIEEVKEVYPEITKTACANTVGRRNQRDLFPYEKNITVFSQATNSGTRETLSLPKGFTAAAQG